MTRLLGHLSLQHPTPAPYQVRRPAPRPQRLWDPAWPAHGCKRPMNSFCWLSHCMVSYRGLLLGPGGAGMGGGREGARMPGVQSGPSCLLPGSGPVLSNVAAALAQARLARWQKDELVRCTTDSLTCASRHPGQAGLTWMALQVVQQVGDALPTPGARQKSGVHRLSRLTERCPAGRAAGAG